MTNKTKTDASFAALNRALTSFKAEIKDLEPGSYIVDKTFRVKGTIKKGDGYSSETSAYPWKKLAIALANRVNQVTLESVVGMAGDDDKEMRPDVEQVLGVIREKTIRNCSGKVTGNVILEEV